MGSSLKSAPFFLKFITLVPHLPPLNAPGPPTRGRRRHLLLCLTEGSVSCAEGPSWGHWPQKGWQREGKKSKGTPEGDTAQEVGPDGRVLREQIPSAHLWFSSYKWGIFCPDQVVSWLEQPPATPRLWVCFLVRAHTRAPMETKMGCWVQVRCPIKSKNEVTDNNG